MDIRTKLVFAQVSVALVSMLALGFAMFGRVEVALHDSTRDHLEGLAEFKVESLEQVLGGWHDRISLVASRTQLRLSLDGFIRTGSPVELERMERILDDAVSASPLFRALTVRDVDGNVLLEVTSPEGLAEEAATATVRGSAEITKTGGAQTRYEGVTFRVGSPPTVTFSAPLILDGVTLGYVYGIMTTDEIVSLTGNTQGLGETGEAMVVVRDANGGLRTLHRVRNALGLDEERLEGTGDFNDDELAEQDAEVFAGLELGTDGPALRSLAGEEPQLVEGLLDYRGQIVMAATRFFPETNWGIVVKVDRTEQRMPTEAVRSESLLLAVTLAAFAILFGTLLGYRFAQPIHILAETAGKIGSGQLDARSGLDLEDEVGLLARTFDQMAGALEEQVALLSEFRRFFDVSLDMMCIASVDGYFKKVNPAFVRELGWPEDELLRRPFIEMVHPDDVASTIAEVEKLAGGSPTIRFENRYLCLDGSFKTLHWNAFPEEESGRLYAIARVRRPKGSDAF
jgi:PAS domain S-box-containing protein